MKHCYCTTSVCWSIKWEVCMLRFSLHVLKLCWFSETVVQATTCTTSFCWSMNMRRKHPTFPPPYVKSLLIHRNSCTSYNNSYILTFPDYLWGHYYHSNKQVQLDNELPCMLLRLLSDSNVLLDVIKHCYCTTSFCWSIKCCLLYTSDAADD